MGPARSQSVGKGWSSPPPHPPCSLATAHRPALARGLQTVWSGGEDPQEGLSVGGRTSTLEPSGPGRPAGPAPGLRPKLRPCTEAPGRPATVHAVGLPAQDMTQQLVLQLPPSQEALRLLMPGIVDSGRRRLPAPRAGILNSEASGGRTSRGLYYITSGQIKQSPRNRSSWPPPLEGTHHRQPRACTPGLTAATGHSARVSALGVPAVQPGCWSLSCRGPQQLQGPT